MRRIKGVLRVLICLVFIGITPLNARASGVIDSNIGISQVGPTGQQSGGPTYARTGWLFYCIDLNNNQVTATKAVACSPIVTKGGTPLPDSNIKLVSRYGVDHNGIDTGCPWGTPFGNQDGNSRTEEVNAYFKEIAENGESRAYNKISSAFGVDVANRWKNKELYYVLEPFYWHDIYFEGTPTGIWYCTTAYYWGWMQNFIGLPEKGDSKIRRYTNGVYNYCIQLEDTQEIRALGYTPPADNTQLRTNTDMNTKLNGNGIGIYWYGEGAPASVQTYWSPFGSPGKPEQAGPSGSPKYGTLNIVKSYYTDENNGQKLTFDGNFTSLNTAGNISIMDEPNDYKLVAWEITTELNTDPKVVSNNNLVWNPDGTTLKSGSKPENVNVQAPAKTVYLLFKKVETKAVSVNIAADFILHESMITRRIFLSKPDSTIGNLLALDKVSMNYGSSAHQSSCGGHGSWPNEKHCSGFGLTDASASFSMANSKFKDYPDILATKSGLGQADMIEKDKGVARRVYSYTRKGLSADNVTINNWDYAAMLMRGKDKLTLAEWKNDDLKPDITNLAAHDVLTNASTSGFLVGNNPLGTRRDSAYADKFSTDFVDKSGSANDDGSRTEPKTESEPSDDDGCGSDTETYSLSTETKMDIDVKVEAYSGRSNTSSIDVNSSPRTNLQLGAYKYSSGIEVYSGESIKFYPYIKMRYNVLANDMWLPAYVMGQHNRELFPNDYAEISWGVNNRLGKLTVNSLQWSTHASATDYVKTTFGNDKVGEIKVLPGGATLSLVIKESDRLDVQLTTWQCILEGKGLEHIQKTTGSEPATLRESNAKSNHDSYVSSVINDLEKVSIEQWVTSKIDKDKDVWDCSNASVVGPGLNLSAAKHGDQEGSTESKYYIRPEGTGGVAEASEGDLDVQNVSTTTTYYTIFTNTKGEIRYIKGDSLAQTAELANKGNENRGQIADKNSGEIKTINDRTHIIDKLEDVLERGTGNDTSGTSLTGTHWYNEAFDGITIMVQNTKLKVGFVAPAERSTVLDPKLTQTSDGQKDAFNPLKYNMSQFRTKSYSENYAGESGSGKNNKLGIFKNVPVYTVNLNKYFESDRFLIPNLTVQDLN